MKLAGFKICVSTYEVHCLSRDVLTKTSAF